MHRLEDGICKNRLCLILVTIFILTLKSNLTMASFIFSDSGYAKNIQINTFILSKNQVSNLFSDNEVNQKSNKELSTIGTSLVVLMQNQGNKGVWGKISTEINNSYKINIDVPFLGANMKEAVIFVVPLGKIIFPRNDDTPSIKINWGTINAK